MPVPGQDGLLNVIKNFIISLWLSGTIKKSVRRKGSIFASGSESDCKTTLIMGNKNPFSAKELFFDSLVICLPFKEQLSQNKTKQTHFFVKSGDIPLA